MKSIFWLGAHKTGTTYLQRCLDLSQDALQRHGIQYTELGEFRELYGRPLLNDQGDGAPTVSRFDIEGDGQILVFDENIPGYVQHALSKRGFYPDVVKRTDAVAGHLRVRPDEIVYGARSYVGYLPSLYIETLKSTPFVTFDDFLMRAFRPGRFQRVDDRSSTLTMASAAPTDFSRLNWYHLLDRLATAYPQARLRVYFHEGLRGHESALLADVLGIIADEVTLLGKEERVGFSTRAVTEMHELHEHRPVDTADVRRLVRAHPTGPANPTYAPLDDAERQELDANYARDVDRIRSDDRFDVIELAD